MLRKRFSNWKLKTFITASPYCENIEADNVSANANKAAEKKSHFKANPDFNSEFINKSESEFIEYKRRNDNNDINNYNNDYNQSDFAYKSYNHPFTPEAAQSNIKTAKNNNNNNHNVFSRKELNEEFENKQNQHLNNCNNNIYQNLNQNNNDDIPNGNGPLNISKNKTNSLLNKSIESRKAMTMNENQDEYTNNKKLHSSLKAANRTNSKIKYNPNFELDNSRNNKYNTNYNYRHANTTRNKNSNSASKNIKNADCSSHNQYSSLFAMNNNNNNIQIRNASNEKLKSPQKIYDKLHQVN